MDEHRRSHRPGGRSWSLEREATLAYYAVRIRPAPTILRNVQLTAAGMPVESFIETERRTALSYALKPLTDNFTRAFREQ